MVQRTQVFVSYSRRDAEWLERLKVHLRPFERAGRIDCWDDTRIQAGERWREEIRDALAVAKVAVLLVSADFLGSDFISSEELPPLLAAADEEGASVLPVIVSPSSFERTELANFQFVNPPSQPLDALSKSEQEAVFVRVANAVDGAISAPLSRPAGKPLTLDLGDPANFDLDEYDECLEYLLLTHGLIGVAVAISAGSARNFPKFLERRLQAKMAYWSGTDVYVPPPLSLKAPFGSIDGAVQDLQPYTLRLKTSDLLLSVRADDESRLARFWEKLTAAFNASFEHSFLVLIIKEVQLRPPDSITHNFSPPQFRRNHVFKWVMSLASGLTDDLTIKEKLARQWTDEIMRSCIRDETLHPDRVYDHIEMSLDRLKRKCSVDTLYEFLDEWKANVQTPP